MPATNGKSNRSKFFAYLMFGDIFLVGLQPILIQASKVGGKYAYNPLTLNLLIEATKTTVMLSLLLIRGIGKNKYGSPSLQSVKQMLRQNYDALMEPTATRMMTCRCLMIRSLRS